MARSATPSVCRDVDGLPSPPASVTAVRRAPYHTLISAVSASPLFAASGADALPTAPVTRRAVGSAQPGTQGNVRPDKARAGRGPMTLSDLRTPARSGYGSPPSTGSSWKGEPLSAHPSRLGPSPQGTAASCRGRAGRSLSASYRDSRSAASGTKAPRVRLISGKGSATASGTPAREARTGAKAAGGTVAMHVPWNAATAPRRSAPAALATMTARGTRASRIISLHATLDKGIDSAPPPRSVACAAMAVVEQRSAACAAAPCRRAAWACGGVPFLGHERWLLEWQEVSEPPLPGRWQIGSDERLGVCL